MATTNDELLNGLFGDAPHDLRAPLSIWLHNSRHFAAFVGTYRTKIRKKLRLAVGESVGDLHLELETAYLLLHAPDLVLRYEPQPVGRARTPDFALDLGSARTHLEVTRIRTLLVAAQLAEHLELTIAAKLGQLAADAPNVLLIAVAAPTLTTEMLRAILGGLQRRAEADDAVVLQRAGLRDRAAFFGAFQCLSAIIVRPLAPGTPPILWHNPQARHPLPARVQRVLMRSLDHCS